MISFRRLGEQGLGNQLFQYAFVRTTARRLGVRFFCPHWIGDDVLHLDDASERATQVVGIDKWFLPESVCFDESALAIEDGTEIYGYFQSERFFADPDAVRHWYRFRRECVEAVEARHSGIDFAESVGIHLRFGDQRLLRHYYLPYPDYYRRAIELVGASAHTVVFSDEPDRAKAHLQSLPGRFLFIEGNEAYEDLYLMTRCRAFVCSTSTFCWWGAWLNPNPHTLVVVPEEGHFGPLSPYRCESYWCDGWIQLPALGFTPRPR